MVDNFKGILLRKTKFSDSGVVLNIYTEKYGYQSYMRKSSQLKKNGLHLGGLASLSLLEITAKIPNSEKMTYVDQISLYFAYHQILYNYKKTAILLFLNEVLLKLLNRQGEDAALYSFLEQALMELETMEEPPTDFHLKFLIQLSVVLGLEPRLNYSGKILFFCLETATFQASKDTLHTFLNENCSYYLLENLTNTKSDYKLNVSDRKLFLQQYLDYISLYIEHFSDFKTLEVLEDVMRR